MQQNPSLVFSYKYWCSSWVLRVFYQLSNLVSSFSIWKKYKLIFSPLQISSTDHQLWHANLSSICSNCSSDFWFTHPLCYQVNSSDFESFYLTTRSPENLAIDYLDWMMCRNSSKLIGFKVLNSFREMKCHLEWSTAISTTIMELIVYQMAANVP